MHFATTAYVESFCGFCFFNSERHVFKKFLEKEIKKDEKIDEAINGIQYSYDLDLLIYTKDVDGKIIRSDSEKLMAEAIGKYMGMDMSGMMTSQNDSALGSMMGSSSMMGGGQNRVWTEILPAKDGTWLHFDYVPGEGDVRTGSADVIGRLCVIGAGIDKEKIKELFGI